MKTLKSLGTSDSGQDIAEYAVMLAVVLVIAISTVQLIGKSAQTIFSQTASALTQ